MEPVVKSLLGTSIFKDVIEEIIQTRSCLQASGNLVVAENQVRNYHRCPIYHTTAFLQSAIRYARQDTFPKGREYLM
jgi:hypothetical protein